MNGGEGGWLLAWLGLAMAAVVLNDYPATSPILRYSLVLVIVFLLLTNVERIAPLVDQAVARMRPTGGGPGTRRAQ